VVSEIEARAYHRAFMTATHPCYGQSRLLGTVWTALLALLIVGALLAQS
jgi:hypothetical protein